MVDFSVLDYDTHEDYLKSFSTKKDYLYLGSQRVVTSLAKLGYRSTKIPYDEPEFLRRHDLAMQAIRPKIMGIQPFSTFMSPTNKDPVLLEFKRREEPIYSKNLAVSICIYANRYIRKTKAKCPIDNCFYHVYKLLLFGNIGLS